MAGAARVPLLLLLLLAAVALPALVQGFVPIGTFQRQHGGDAKLDGDAWRRSSSAKEAGAGAGGLHPLHHYPKSFHHNFIRRPGKSLLEDAPGEERGLDIHPTWQRRYHGQHHRHAEGHHGDVGLAGEHHRHRGLHAGFREHHRRDRLPARMMAEGEWREGDSVHSRVGGHRRHAGFRHGAKHWSADRAGREFGGGEFRHFRDTGRVRDVRPYEARSPGAWESFKSKLADGASSVAAKIQSAGNQLRNWVSPSRPRVAPTVSFAAEPLWLEAPSLSSCGGLLDTKYRDLLVEVVENVSVSTTSGTSCTETLELLTRQLMHTLKRRLIASCSKDLEAGCQQNTCNFINRYPRLATTIVLSKFHIDPVSSIKSTCSSKEIADIYRNVHHLSRRVHASLDSLPLENSLENQADADEGKPVCEVCLQQNFVRLKEMFLGQLWQTCQQAACPKLKDACDFVRDHGILGRTLLMLKLKPWLKVAQSCASSCSASSLPLSLSTSTPSVEGEPLPWQYLNRRPSQPAIFNLHRAMQLRGFESSDATELSSLFDWLQNVGSRHPHFVIAEFVRQNPLTLREMLDTMHQIFAADDVKLEGEDKQADKVPLEDKEANAKGALEEAPTTMDQDLVVGGEGASFKQERPEADVQEDADTVEPAEEPLKEQFVRALNHVFGEGGRTSLLPQDSVALSGNKELQAKSPAEASEQLDARRADM